MTETPTLISQTLGAHDARSLANPTAGFRAAVRRGVYPVVPKPVLAALNAREVLQDATQRLYDDLPPVQDLPGRILAALRDEQPLDQALDSAVDIHLQRQRADIAANLIAPALGEAERFLRATIADALPQILDGLRPLLEQTAKTLRQAYDDAGTLDIQGADPLDVAQATKAQQAALVTIDAQTREYHRIRRAQREALTASSLPVPGDNEWRASWRWDDFFATGLHEVSAPGIYGLPGEGQAPRNAVRAVVTRRDMWLPGPEEMHEAWDRLEAEKRAHAAQDAADAQQRATDRETTFGDLQPGSVAYLDAVSHNGARR